MLFVHYLMSSTEHINAVMVNLVLKDTPSPYEFLVKSSSGDLQYTSAKTKGTKGPDDPLPMNTWFA